MKTVFYVSLLIWGCASQATEIICYNPPSGADSVILQQSALDEITQQAKEIVEVKWKDLSIEEAVVTLPAVVNETFTQLFLQQLAPNSNFSIAPTIAATIKGVLDTKMGQEVISISLQDPLIFPQVMVQIVGTFDGGCMDEPNVILFENYDAMLSSIFPISSKEQIADVIVQTGILTAIQYNLTVDYEEVLGPLTSLQIPEMSVGDALLGLFSSDAGDIILQFLSEAINGIFINPVGIAEAITNLITNIQTFYDMDTAELISLALDIFNKIAEQLG